MYVDVDLILNTMERTGLEAVIEVESEQQYESLIESMEEKGHMSARGPDYSTMSKNSDIVRKGGRLSVSFYNNASRICWSGFCWPAYFENKNRIYACIPSGQVFVEDDTDFDFDLDHAALSDLFCSGGAIND